MQPEVDTAREFWLPTAEQTAELEGLTPRPRGIRETEFYLAWRQARLQENARRKAQNDITKTRIDLETKVLQERQDTISKLMGDILENLTKASLDKIEKYVKPASAPEPVRGDWPFIFEAARARGGFTFREEKARGGLLIQAQACVRRLQSLDHSFRGPGQGLRDNWGGSNGRGEGIFLFYELSE